MRRSTTDHREGDGRSAARQKADLCAGYCQARLVRRTSDDPDSMATYDFDFHLADARVVKVQSPFFFQFVDLVRARTLAADIAAALT